MARYLGSKSLGAQISLLALGLILVIFTVVTMAGGLYGRQTMRSTAENELQRQADVTGRMLEFYYEELEKRAQEYATILRDSMKSVGIVSVDQKNFKPAGDYEKVPVVRAGYQSLNNNPFFVDRLATQTGGQASVLVLLDGEFIRITTSLTDANGDNATGTTLETDGPAQRALMAGDFYVGLKNLFGESYMVRYEPILGDDGKVAAALAVAVDYSAPLARLRETVGSITFGETGSAFAFRRDGDHRVLIHSDKAILGHPLNETPYAPPADARDEWFGNSAGIGTFERGGATELVAYRPVKGWDWTLVAGGPIDEFEAAGNRFAMLLSAICIAGGIVLLAALFFGIRVLLKPLRSLREKVRSLGEGDLTVCFATDATRNEHSQNEIAELRGDLQATTDQFSHLIRQIHESAGNVASASTRLLDVTRDSATGAETQQQEADQVATAMTQMAQTVQEVARHASEASSASATADQQANAGRELVEDTAGAIERFVGEIEATAESLKDVEKASARIGTVIELINGISEQTNLLALNAAIEASRAGDHGRGFAVVADEVRSLAGRTQAATQEIQQVIDSLQTQTRDAVSRMEVGQSTGGETADRSRRAAEALSEITEAFARISALTTDIATAAEEQTEVAENINQSVVRIRDVSQETASRTQQASEAGRDLDGMASALTQQVQAFRV